MRFQHQERNGTGNGIMGNSRRRRWLRREPGIGYIALYWPSIADGVFAGLIVVMGIVGLSPLAGIEAAGETIRDRRRRRALRAAIRVDHGDVWANYVRRGGRRYAQSIGEP
jgi:hypothetical protein